MSAWGNKDFANNEPKVLQTNTPGNTNLYMATDTRLANATFGSGKGVAHSGWVNITQGTGFIKEIIVSKGTVTTDTFANGFLTITGGGTANTTANARLLVLGTNNVSIILNSGGSNYESTPTIAAPAGSNNANLTFSVVMGGRANRVQAETLVALSEETALDTNSGLPYFTGV
jgi:hypothetical protein